MMRSKRPDRFPRKSCVRSLVFARGLRWISVTVEPVRSGLVDLFTSIYTKGNLKHEHARTLHARLAINRLA